MLLETWTRVSLVSVYVLHSHCNYISYILLYYILLSCILLSYILLSFHIISIFLSSLLWYIWVTDRLSLFTYVNVQWRSYLGAPPSLYVHIIWIGINGHLFIIYVKQIYFKLMRSTVAKGLTYKTFMPTYFIPSYFAPHTVSIITIWCNKKKKWFNLKYW